MNRGPYTYKRPSCQDQTKAIMLLIINDKVSEAHSCLKYVLIEKKI